MNATMQEAMNGQLNSELYSSYLYLSMSAFFESKEHKGMANWMRVQAQEELAHAIRFFDFINGSGGLVVLTSVDAPPTKWASPQAVYEHVLAHERKVTGLINGLVTLADRENDRRAHEFLQWFVKEQEEEEESAEGALGKVRAAGDDPKALKAVDSELGKRVFHPPK